MQALIRWIVLAEGWPRRLTAAGAGAIGALALAPFDVFPAMIVPMAAAVWLIDGAARGEGLGFWSRRLHPRSCVAAAAVGWWWGFGYFLAGFWWLGAAFLVDARDLWAMPLGVIAVPAMLALFPAVGFGLARFMWSPGRRRVLALAGGLGASEWGRAHLFTGFPWNNYGMAFGGNLVLSQAASLFGNAGLTLLVILVCAAPATLADPAPLGRRGSLPWRGAPTGAAVLAVAALALFGAARLSRDDGKTVEGVRLRIIQPNVPQDGNFSYANKDKIVADYLELSDRATSPEHSGLADVTHLIWPESAFPFILARDPEALDTIGKALPAGTLLLTGAARLGIPTGGPRQEPVYYNSIEIVGPGGTILDAYDKVHLVPFGEYLPFDRALRSLGLSHFVHIPGGFTAGTRHRVLDVPNLPPVAPLICYEAIFSAETLPARPPDEGARAGMILNVTNDGWFGRTPGPYQHLAQARLRSVEFGLPLVRAANTGVSAIISPYGRITASLPLGVRNVLDGPLPQKINGTTYSRNFSIIEPGLYIALILIGFSAGRLRKETIVLRSY